MRRASTVAGTALSILLLAGCAGFPIDKTDPEAQSAHATSSPSATGSTSATATVEPGFTADGALLITPTSVGAFTLDDTTADIAKVTGRDYSEDLEAFGGQCAGYQIIAEGPYRYIGALAMSDGAAGHIDVYSYYAGNTPDDPPARTAEGIGIGSSESDVITAYGDKVEYKADYYDPSKVEMFVTDGDVGMAFQIDADHTVSGWEIGRVEQLNLLEGCA